MQHTAWKDFNTGVWDKAVDVRDLPGFPFPFSSVPGIFR